MAMGGASRRDATAPQNTHEYPAYPERAFRASARLTARGTNALQYHIHKVVTGASPALGVPVASCPSSYLPGSLIHSNANM